MHHSPSGRIRSVLDVYEAFPTERAAVDHLAQLRWPSGPVCPSCGTMDRYYRIHLRYKCAYCKSFWSVRKDTIFEDSKISLRKWFAGIYLFMVSRKGVSSLQLRRQLGLSKQAAWFMLSRLRQVADNMAAEVLEGIVEVDECYVGGRNKNRHADKKFENWVDGFQIVVGAASRDSEMVITERVPNREAATLHNFIRGRVRQGSHVYTDDHRGYGGLWYHDYRHKKTNHNIGQYVDGDVHSQNIESFWAIVKRAHKGTYHWWSDEHFDLYMREFEMRWNLRKLPEGARVDVFLQNVNGTRLSYKDLKNGNRPVLRRRRARELRTGINSRGRRKRKRKKRSERNFQ